VPSGYVHQALIELAPGVDEGAPGAAVTVRLCGHWEHEGACRWPHHTGVDARSGRSIRVRTVFVCDGDDENVVRRRISDALDTGRLDTPQGERRWTTLESGAAELRPAEAELAARLDAGRR
jgi:hypothetical protein